VGGARPEEWELPGYPVPTTEPAPAVPQPEPVPVTIPAGMLREGGVMYARARGEFTRWRLIGTVSTLPTFTYAGSVDT
jgi:hypothetical protein